MELMGWVKERWGISANYFSQSTQFYACKSEHLGGPAGHVLAGHAAEAGGFAELLLNQTENGC